MAADKAESPRQGYQSCGEVMSSPDYAEALRLIRKFGTDAEPVGQMFDTLTSDQLTAVMAEAEEAYRTKTGKPLSAASKSFVRKRYELLQQRAAR